MKDFISPDLLLLLGTLAVFFLIVCLYIWSIGREDKKQRDRLRAPVKWWESADSRAPTPQPCAGCAKPITLAQTWYSPLKKGPLCEDCYWKDKLTPRTTVANLSRSRGHQFDRHYTRDSGHTSVDFTEAATFGAFADTSNTFADTSNAFTDSGSSTPSPDFSGGGGDFGGGGSSDSY